MGELFTTQDINIGENDWGMISKDPVIYESGVENAIVEITDMENEVHKLTFRKGGSLNIGRDGSKLHIQWDEKDTI